MSTKMKMNRLSSNRYHRDKCIIINDLKRGFFSNRYRYIIAITVLLLVIIVMGNNEFGFLDTIFFLQAGYGTILSVKEGKIVFPVVWIMMQFLVPFLVYDYCNDDIENIGVDFLIKCEDRALWWRSKCIWNILTTVSMYAIVYIMAFLYGMYNGKSEWTINYELFNTISNKPLPYNNDSINIIIYLITVPILVSICLALIQMTLSMYTSPMIGIIVVMAWDVISVFVNITPMIGNVSMVVRSSLYSPGGLPVWIGIIYSVGLYIVTYIVGKEMFKRKDILQREGE